METLKNLESYLLIDVNRQNNLISEEIKFDNNFIHWRSCNKVGFIILDFINKSICCSPRLYLTLGYEPGEICTSYDYLERLIHPSDLVIIEELIRNQIQNSNKVLDIKIRFKTKNGTYLFYNTTIRLICDSKLQPYYN